MCLLFQVWPYSIAENWGDIANRKTDELYEFPIIIQVVIKSFERTTDRRIKEKKGITQVWKFSSQWHRLGNSYLVTQPSRNLTEQGLNLMCGRERCRRCGIMTRRLIIFFYLPKGNKKKRKRKISDIAWENKERKKNTTINENQNPIIVALLIGQETRLSRLNCLTHCNI